MTLKGAKPPVWRRIPVPGEIRLSRLHDVLQAALGWANSHLHEFRVGRHGRIGAAGPLWDAPGEVMDEGKVALSSVAPEPKDKLTYVYDFGDDWEHTVAVEKIREPSPGVLAPSCLAGKGACPPEDRGGVWGYAEPLEVLADPHRPEREERQGRPQRLPEEVTRPAGSQERPMPPLHRPRPARHRPGEQRSRHGAVPRPGVRRGLVGHRRSSGAGCFRPSASASASEGRQGSARLWPSCSGGSTRGASRAEDV